MCPRGQPASITRASDSESRPTTVGEDQFLTDSFTFAIPKGGEHTLILRSERPPAGPWLVLKTVRLVPIRRSPPVDLP